MELFTEFVDRKQRDAKKHLKIIERMFKTSGLQAKGYFEEDNPYVFVKAPKSLSFEGVRIYEIGNMVAYRVVNEEKTEPYGKAYQLNLEEMFNDYMSENVKEEEAGKKVIQSVVSELKRFFDKSEKAEEDLETAGEPGVVVQSSGVDLANLVFTRN